MKYARIVDGECIEYPVDGVFVGMHADAHYEPVVQTEAPPVLPWQYAKQIKPSPVNGKWVSAWVVVDKPQLSAEDSLMKAKYERQMLVDEISVTTQSGKVFDGNEDAQRRMTSAITAMDDGDELPWVLHDNTVAVVTRAELREALRLAGSEMATIWISPYVQS